MLRLRSILATISLCLLSFCAGAVSPTLELLPLEKWGIKSQTEMNKDQSTVTLVDEKNGTKTIFEYGTETKTQKVSHFNKKEVLTATHERRGNVSTHIDYQASPPERVELYFTPSEIKKISSALMNGQWVTQKTEVVPHKSFMMCNDPATEASLGSSLSSFQNNGMDIIAFESSPGSTYLGSNTHVSGCETLPPEGNKTLAEDLTSAYNQGFSCLDRVFEAGVNSSDETVVARAQKVRDLSLRLLGNFIPGANDVFTFQCLPPGRRENLSSENLISADVYGIAITVDKFSDHSIAPGIQLNLPHLVASSSMSRQSLMFHELLHHGNLYHGGYEEVDWVYDLQFCCFGLPDEPHLDQEVFKKYTCEKVLKKDHGSPRR
jgi:hypothetical protein